MRRVIFQEWIVELGRDPARFDSGLIGREPTSPDAQVSRINRAVRQALDNLPEGDRELLERFYFMGQGYRELATKTGRSRHRLESQHHRAVQRLRRELKSFVREQFGIEPRRPGRCPICASPDRPAIDRLIARRDPTETWRPIIRRLRDEFHVRVATPQVVISHAAYH